MSSVLSALLSVLSLAWVLIVISPHTYRPLMLLIGVWAIIRSTPTKGRYGQAIDAAWVAAALFSLGWPIAQSEAFFSRASSPLPADLVAGAVAVILLLEAARRTTGWLLPISALVLLAYAQFRQDLPRLIGHLYMSLEGIYGVPLEIAATYLILLSIYAAVLERSGAVTLFLNFAMSFWPRGTSAKPVEYLHFLSLAVGVYLAVTGVPLARAVFWAIVTAIGVSFAMPRDYWLTPRRTAVALAAGGRYLLPILAVAAVLGIVLEVLRLVVWA